MFDIMSGQSTIDHPLCEECTDTLLDQLDQQLKITDDELKDYKVFFEKLNDKPSLDGEALSKELEELIKKLEEIEMERSKVAEKLEAEKERSKQLEIEENKYWMEYSEYQKELLESEDEQQR